MIVTITLNPALRVGYVAPHVAIGAVNQISQVSYRAGGAGLAVARILHTFGHEVVAAGLAGGAAGELIRAELSRSGIATQFTPIAMESRRVLQVTDSPTGAVTAFDEPAPYITTEELGRLARDYRGLMDGATAVVLCGSLPAGLPPEIYTSLVSYAAEAGVPAILAAGAGYLWHAAVRRPALLIPQPQLLGHAGHAGQPGHAGHAGYAGQAGQPGQAGHAGYAGQAVSGQAGQAGHTGYAGQAVSGQAGQAGQAVPGQTGQAAQAPGWQHGLELGRPQAGPGSQPVIDLAALVARGARAAVSASGGVACVATPAGQWRAFLPGVTGEPSRDALVAGFVPGIALGWSWDDTLRHAVALAAVAPPAGDVDLAQYEALLPSVHIDPPAT